jgi:3-hydroxyisobutyrate dehydrogenase-like beta-hydroxyacid dehydrogenase
MTGGLKDVNLMLSTATEAGSELKIGEIVAHMLSEGVSAGMGERDWSSIHEISRRKAGLD